MGEPITAREHHSDCTQDGHDWRLVSHSEAQDEASTVVIGRREVYKCARCPATKVVVVRED